MEAGALTGGGSLRSLYRWGLQVHEEIQVRLQCNVKELNFQWLDELNVFVFCFQEFIGQDEQVWAVSFAGGFVWELYRSSARGVHLHFNLFFSCNAINGLFKIIPDYWKYDILKTVLRKVSKSGFVFILRWKLNELQVLWFGNMSKKGGIPCEL